MDSVNGVAGQAGGAGAGANAAPSGPRRAEAVGYLKGRGGVGTTTPDEAQAEWRALFAALRAQIDELEQQALSVEAGMAGIGQGLTRSQPPMWNRVVLRWWRLRGGARREPVLARVESGANSKAKVEPVGRNARLRTDRGFGLCADLAKQLVRNFWALAAVRKEIVSQVAELSRVAKASDRRGAVISRVTSESAGITATATERLRDVGYDVPAETTDPD